MVMSRFICGIFLMHKYTHYLGFFKLAIYRKQKNTTR